MRIFWTPTDTGAFKAWVTVTDGKARDSIAWNIHVVDTVTINHAPIFSALTRQTLESDTVWYKNTQYTRVLSATDKDPDLLIFSVSAPLILSGDVSITWTPTDTGVTKIRAIVSDSKAQDTIEWRMHVIDSTKDTNSINLARGLVAWYPFNGNAKDESGNGNDGTVNGATLTTDRYGASDKAYSFDGVNDNILVAHSTLPKGDNTISYSAWINVNAPLNIYGSVIDAGKPGIRSKRIALHVELDSLIKFTGQNNDYRFDQAPIKSNQWYHVFIQKVNRNVSLYLNGLFIYTATLTEDITLDTTTISIGSNGGAWAAGDQFKGSIDDIRIYSRRLYKNEIDSLYREGGLGWQNQQLEGIRLDSGLVAYYPFNGNATDESGRNNNGTVNGATLDTDRFGANNKAYKFDGVASYIDCGNPIDFQFGTSPLTFSAWIYREQSTKDEMIITKERENQPSAQLRLAIRADNATSNDVSKAYFAICDTNNAHGMSWSSSDGYKLRSISNIVTNNWTYIVATRNGTVLKLYIDGVFQRSDTTAVTLFHSNNYPLYIGAKPNPHETGPTGLFKGKIDDIRIYNRVISNREIDSLFQKID
jgi:hypothetical protein